MVCERSLGRVMVGPCTFILPCEKSVMYQHGSIFRLRARNCLVSSVRVLSRLAGKSNYTRGNCHMSTVCLGGQSACIVCESSGGLRVLINQALCVLIPMSCDADTLTTMPYLHFFSSPHTAVYCFCTLRDFIQA